MCLPSAVARGIDVGMAIAQDHRPSFCSMASGPSAASPQQDSKAQVQLRELWQYLCLLWVPGG